MRITTLLKSVPYDLPPHRARVVEPSIVGTKAIKVYQVSPSFWAIVHLGVGCFRVQKATVFGAGHHGYEVTAKAAAGFISHTAHPYLLLAHIQKLGWLDLALELQTVIARTIKTARRINQFNHHNETFTKN